MDNRLDLPGYKYYTDAAGRRPPVHVAFADIAATGPDARVIGVLREVTPADLLALDRRERNYRRVRVDSATSGGDGRPVWVYAGTEEARRRLHAGRGALRAGRRDGSLVIQAAYLRAVLDGFADLSAGAAEACRRDLDPGEIPVRELTRHELPV